MANRRKLLCIDPGHGMGNAESGAYDPGAVGGGVAEADIALQWALTLKHVATQNGIDVVMTRDDASDVVPVWQRDDLARMRNADWFISLHCNAIGGPRALLARGTETIIADDAGVDSSRWAQQVQRACLLAMGGPDRGVKFERQTPHKKLAVLRSSHRFPSCLLEIGFISNKSDRDKMLRRDVRLAFANNLIAMLVGLKLR